jgi:uncharacterized protein YjbI with pentapeptide repeats
MEYKDELTPLETRLVECAAAGDELDCAPTGATTAEVDQINDWEERKIRAEVLIALCTGEVSDWSVHPRRGLQLRGAYIPGQVDLSRAQMNECPLTFHTCRFEEELVLYQATTSELSFTSCVLPSLYANELNSGASLRLTRTHLRRISLLRADFRGIVGLSEVSLSNPKSRALNAERMSASGIFLVGTHVEGEVRLLGANISGQLKCSGGTQLSNPKCTALNANGMSVSSVSLRDTHVEGTARLVGANIAGQLGCDEGTELINSGSYALDAARLTAGDVFLKGTYAKGEVRLVGANIAGPLVCQQGAKLINRGGHALNAYGVSASSVSLNATHVEGEVRFLGANIGDQLDCSGGTELINPSGHALNAEGCQVGRVLHFSLEEPSVGSVNLAYAQIGTLADNLASWPDTYHLVGFIYNSLGGDQDLKRRLTWIGKSEPFSPHVYTQLAEVYRRSGHEGFARKVAIRREKERGRQPDLSLGSRAWNRFLGFTVAYGYRPWQAGVYLVVLFILGWILFTLPSAQEVMVHPSAKKGDLVSAAACHAPYPCFSPPIYVLDTLLPIVDLHQESNWVPTRPRPWAVWYEVLTWGSSLSAGSSPPP